MVYIVTVSCHYSIDGISQAHASVIFWQPQNKNYAWWQNRNNRVMQNWGGAPTGTHGCGCSTEAEGASF